MSSGTSHPRRLTQNSVGLRWPRFQKTGLRKYRSNILTSTRRLPLSPSFYVHFSLYPSRICILPTLKLMTFPSPFSLPFYALICYAFVQSCLFGRTLSTRLGGRVINHFCTRYAIFLCSLRTATYWNYM